MKVHFPFSGQRRTQCGPITKFVMSNHVYTFSKMVTLLGIIMTIGDYHHDARHNWLQALVGKFNQY